MASDQEPCGVKGFRQVSSLKSIFRRPKAAEDVEQHASYIAAGSKTKSPTDNPVLRRPKNPYGTPRQVHGNRVETDMAHPRPRDTVRASRDAQLKVRNLRSLDSFNPIRKPCCRSRRRCSVSPISRLLSLVGNGNNLDSRSRNPIDNKVWKAFHQIPLCPLNVVRPCVWTACNNGSRTFQFASEILRKSWCHIKVVVVNCEHLGTGIWMEPERKVSHFGGRAFLP